MADALFESVAVNGNGMLEFVMKTKTKETEKVPYPSVISTFLRFLKKFFLLWVNFSYCVLGFRVSMCSRA